MFVCWSWGKKRPTLRWFFQDSFTSAHWARRARAHCLSGQETSGHQLRWFLEPEVLAKNLHMYIYIYIYIWPICIHMYSYVYLYIPKMWQPKWQHPILEPLLGHRFPCLLMQPILGHVRHEMRNPKVQNVSWEKISLGPSENPMWCHCNITHASENSS